MKNILASLCLIAATAVAQGPLDPALLLKPLGDSWPTYSGDYSGRRYSSLTQINQSNVKNLTLAWVSRVTAGSGGGGRGGPPLITGGPPTADTGGTTTTNIRASILEVNGILYFSTPDNAWAMDARDGHVLWHYFWRTRGGTHIGNRGLGMWGNWLYAGNVPDDYLICLDAKTGKERWHKELADFNLQYFSTMAPIVIGNHILVGTGDDLDEPGMLQSFDPETGGPPSGNGTPLPWRKDDPPASPPRATRLHFRETWRRQRLDPRRLRS